MPFIRHLNLLKVHVTAFKEFYFLILPLAATPWWDRPHFLIAKGRNNGNNENEVYLWVRTMAVDVIPALFYEKELVSVCKRPVRRLSLLPSRRPDLIATPAFLLNGGYLELRLSDEWSRREAWGRLCCLAAVINAEQSVCQLVFPAPSWGGTIADWWILNMH